MMSLAKSKLTWQQVSKILTDLYQMLIQQRKENQHESSTTHNL